MCFTSYLDSSADLRPFLLTHAALISPFFSMVSTLLTAAGPSEAFHSYLQAQAAQQFWM